MAIGTRIRELRARRNLSQGDIEAKTGLLRCYISRVENGHTVPSVETLERFANAFEVPLYTLFYSEDGVAEVADPSVQTQGTELRDTPPEERFLVKLKELTPRLSDADRDVLLMVAKKLARH